VKGAKWCIWITKNTLDCNQSNVQPTPRTLTPILLLAYCCYSTATAATATKHSRRIFYRSRVIAHFVPNFVLPRQRRSIGKKFGLQRSAANPENPIIDAKILQISLAESQVIAHFVQNFVAIATWVGCGKMVCSVRRCNPQNSLLTQKIFQVSFTKAKL